MNPAQLLEHFDRISEAPDAVARLRRFILDLAVRGKLVEQDPKDEPAAELLKRIQSEKMRLEKSGAIRKEKPLPPVSETPYAIPSSWVWTRLASTGRVFNGNSVSESAKAELSTVKKGYPFIATKDVGYGRDRLAYENGVNVPFDADGFRIAHSQTVLICAEGGSAGRKMGLTDRDICFGNKLYANETWAGIHPEYILSLYQSTSFYAEFASRMTGIIGGIARSEFLLVPVPLPPEAEQHRIVAKVDELMVLCDQLEAEKNEREARRDRLVAASLNRIGTAPAAADEAAAEAQSAIPLRDAARFHLDHLPRLTTRPEHIKQLRQAILNLAVRGRLVPQDPNNEPAVGIIHSIATLNGKETSKTRKIKQTGCAIGDEEKSFEIPVSWSWTRIGDVCDLISGKGFKADEYANSGLRLFQIANVSFGVTKWETLNYLPLSYREIYPELILSDGDLLIALNRPLLNRQIKAAILLKTDLPAILYQRVGKFIFYSPDVLSKYFLIYLQSSLFIRKLEEKMQGSDQPFINKAQMIQFVIPLPPLAEQHRIVAKVDELMALCDQLEAKLTATQTDSRRLLEAVLDECLMA